MEHILGVFSMGTMGAGIVQLAAQSGYRVPACDAPVETLRRAQVCVDDGLSRVDQRGTFPENEASSHYDHIHWTTNPEKLRDAPAILEAIVEKVEPKKEVLVALDAMLKPDSLNFANTSFIFITDLASTTQRPEKVCRSHFSPRRRCASRRGNTWPPHERRDPRASRGTREVLRQALCDCGEGRARIRRGPFFDIDVYRDLPLAGGGVATNEDIDSLVKNGLGSPARPFELGDFVGLNVALDVIFYVHKQLDEPYYTPAYLRRTRPGRQARTKNGARPYDH